MENEAIIKYKYYLCKTFLDKLLAENIISESQYNMIEKSVIKRLVEI